MSALPRVAYIGLSLELYQTVCKPNLPIWEKAFRNWTCELSKISEVLFSRVVYTDEDVRQASVRIEAIQPDVIVLSAVSYTPSMLIFPALQKWNIPVVIWNTQDSPVIPDDYVPDDLTNNHTVQGIQDLTNVMFQHGMSYRIVSSHWQEAGRLAQLSEEIAVAKAAGAARTLCVLSLGGAFAGMGDFEYEAEQLKQEWGPYNRNIEAAEFLDMLATVDNEQAEQIRLQDLKDFEISPTLQPDTHRESIRRMLAIEKLLKQYQATAFTMNFTSLCAHRNFGQLPFYGINRLMSRGIGYAGEGDVLRAALMRQLVELGSVANFSEIYTVDFLRNRFFMSHMQECNPAMASKQRKVLLKQMPFWVEGSPDYCGMFFTLEPGEYTLVSLTHNPKKGFRFMAFTGNVPANVPFMEHYDRAYWILEPGSPVNEVLDRYSLAGGPHHLSAMSGNQLARLKKLAEALDFDFFDIS